MTSRWLEEAVLEVRSAVCVTQLLTSARAAQQESFQRGDRRGANRPTSVRSRMARSPAGLRRPEYPGSPEDLRHVGGATSSDDRAALSAIVQPSYRWARVLMLWFRFPGLAVVAAVLGVLNGALAAAAPESPRFTRLSVDDGLSQSSVLQILQDRKGLLWFGTQEGLNRYDGYRFTVHRARDRDGFLRDHDITALIEDAQGNLWVGTSRGLYRHDLDTGRFDGCAPPVDAPRHPRSWSRSGDGRIFFAASDGRLWMLDPADARSPRALVERRRVRAADRHHRARARPGSAIWAAANGRLFKVDVARAEPAHGSPKRWRISARCRCWRSIRAATSGSAGPTASCCATGPPTARVDRFPQAPRNTLAILPGKRRRDLDRRPPRRPQPARSGDRRARRLSSRSRRRREPVERRRRGDLRGRGRQPLGRQLEWRRQSVRSARAGVPHVQAPRPRRPIRCRQTTSRR